MEQTKASMTPKARGPYNEELKTLALEAITELHKTLARPPYVVEIY
jgi:hypothetical protein